jgi:hypothetical protein
MRAVLVCVAQPILRIGAPTPLRLALSAFSYAVPSQLRSIIMMSSDCPAVPRKRTTVAMIASSAPAGVGSSGPAYGGLQPHGTELFTRPVLGLSDAVGVEE